MNKSSIIALYLLVITNLLGIAWIKLDFKKFWDSPDYGNQVVILNSNINSFDEDTYLNLKVRNDAPVNLKSVEILVNVYDTNNVLLCTIEESLFSTFASGKERQVSAQISYGELEDLESYRFEPSVGAATTF